VKAGFAGGQLPLHMRLPKLRGFKNPFRVEFQVVNLDKLNELFPEVALSPWRTWLQRVLFARTSP
jgi:large subunit ribosomal protein L15